MSASRIKLVGFNASFPELASLCLRFSRFMACAFYYALESSAYSHFSRSFNFCFVVNGALFFRSLVGYPA